MIMNFKDAYNSMTDEIHGNRVLLHSILNGEAEKKKRFNFSFKPVFGTAVAAMLVLTASTLYFRTGINDYSITSEKGIAVSDKANNNNTSAALQKDFPNSGNSEALNEQQTQKDAPRTGKSTAKSAPNTKKTTSEKLDENTSVKKENVTLGEGVIPEISANSHQSLESDNSQALSESLGKTALPSTDMLADSESASVSDVPEFTNADETDNQTVKAIVEPTAPVEQPKSSGGGSASVGGGGSASVGGGGGASMAAWSNNRERTEYVATSDYWSYIGKDISQNAYLPNGYSLNIPAGVEFTYDGDELVSDVLTMTASSDNGDDVVIAVSKECSLGSIYPGAAHSRGDGSNVAVVTSTLSETEVNLIISSIAE